MRDVQLQTVNTVNTEDILRYNKILITRSALTAIAGRTAAKTPIEPSLS